MSRIPTNRTTIAAVTALLLVLADTALGSEMPKRKPGLWEIRTEIQGIPNMPGPIQQCIDQNTDDLMSQSQKGKSDCSAQNFDLSAKGATVHSVCKIAGSTVTTDGIIEGAFDSSYRSNLTMRYNPPMQGMSEAHMTQEARWLGPCKTGQKPGDVMTPNLGTINMQDMMNNSRLKAMMKPQQ